MRKTVLTLPPALLIILWVSGDLIGAGLARLEIPQPQPDTFQLGLVLKSAREYCARLERAALDFICLEEVKEKLDLSRDSREGPVKQNPTIFGPDRLGFKIRPGAKHDNAYLYDYQFVRREGKVEEKRALLEKNGKKADTKTPLPQMRAFTYADILLAPVQLLDERFREYYSYKLLGRDKIGDTEAWILEVAPRLTGVSRYLGGKIWLKTDDSSVLRIEWDPSTFGHYENIQKRAESYKATPEIRSYSEFGFEKNGLRFPSVDFTEEGYRGANGKPFVRARTSVVYKDYKFFTVETESAVKIRSSPSQSPLRPLVFEDAARLADLDAGHLPLGVLQEPDPDDLGRLE